MLVNEFKQKVDDKKIRIGVVGLGYVGLNVACLFAKNSYEVRGYDVNERKVLMLNMGKNPIPEEEWFRWIAEEKDKSDAIVGWPALAPSDAGWVAQTWARIRMAPGRMHHTSTRGT